MEYERRRKAALNPFSPWKSNAETLHRTIVGRDFTIKDILEKTHRFCNGAPPKHCLLVGRRGMGKTHLLSLVYHFYEKNCILPGFETIADDVLAVLLLEEERFSLSSLVTLLMKVFEKLREKAPGLKTLRIPAHLQADEDVIEYCFDNFKNISKSENKKIILLCDNLEDIFKQWKGKEYKILRAFLSDQQAVMILGTAIKIFKEIISPQEPFYEFFEIVPLSDLSDAQMLEMLKRRFIEDGLEEEFNKKEKYLKDKVAAIAKLTGGNPRLVVFLYDIVTKKNVFEVEDATNELMESLSEYFRNRFSDLAPQQRTILDAFAEMEGPATPKEISNKTRIKAQSTHAHIKALKDAGFLEPVEFAKHKITRYDVTERLFRLWRQNATISGRNKFKIFIKFLKLYFTPDELKEDFQRSIKQLDTAFLQNKWKSCEEHLHYLSYLQDAAEGSLKFEIFDKMTDFLLKKGDYEKAEEEIIEFRSEIEVEKKESDLKRVYKKLLQTHLQQERYVEASKDISQLIEYPTSEEKEEYIKILNKIIDKCPDDVKAWVSKGKILVKAGDYKEALKCFDSAIKLNPKEPKYYYEKAVTLYNLDLFKEALPLIDRAIELNRNNATYWFLKGSILGILGKYEEALQAFQKASELNHKEPRHYQLQSDALHNLNRFKEALSLIEKAIKLDGNNVSYWVEKGRIVANLSKYEEVIKAFKRANELKPEEPWFYYFQAFALYKLERFKEALQLIEKAIELDGNNDSYWAEKGRIVGDLGKHEEALQAFQKASELNPEEPGHYQLQSVALSKLNRLKEALPLIEKAIELNGNDARYWGEKGSIVGNMGKYEEALRAFQKASELNPEEPEYYFFQSVALRNLKRVEEAFLLIEKAIELDGKDLSYWKDKAEILTEMGKDEEGMKCFRESLELNPEDIGHKLRFLEFLIYYKKDLEEAGNYIKEIEKTLQDRIKDNSRYFDFKSDYLILTCQFEEAVPWIEKTLIREPNDLGARMTIMLNKACLGEFGEQMEGLAGKIRKENLYESQIRDVTQFIYRIMEACLAKGDTKRSNGLFLTLLKLKEWHKINEVQVVIALYLRQLVDIKNRELFVNAVNSARGHITDKDLLELIKAFLYAGRYLQEGNKVILEEVFPEIREIILDMIEKFEGKKNEPPGENAEDAEIL